MREFVFPAWCSYGKCDTGESEIVVNLDDATAELLVKYASDPDVYYDGFDSCLELSFLYDLVFKLADEQITEEISFGEIYEFKEGETASKVYPIGIEFPLEFEP